MDRITYEADRRLKENLYGRLIPILSILFSTLIVMVGVSCIYKTWRYREDSSVEDLTISETAENGLLDKSSSELSEDVRSEADESHTSDGNKITDIWSNRKNDDIIKESDGAFLKEDDEGNNNGGEYTNIPSFLLIEASDSDEIIAGESYVYYDYVEYIFVNVKYENDYSTLVLQFFREDEGELARYDQLFVFRNTTDNPLIYLDDYDNRVIIQEDNTFMIVLNGYTSSDEIYRLARETDIKDCELWLDGLREKTE